jgi:hypothetical protein
MFYMLNHFWIQVAVSRLTSTKSQRLNSGVGIFIWFHLGLPPHVLLGVELERRGLTCDGHSPTPADKSARSGVAVM